MSSERPKNSGNKNLENLVIGLGKIAWGISRICWHGFSRTMFKKVEGCLSFLLLALVPLVLVYWDWAHLHLLHWIFPSVFSLGVVRFFVVHVPQFVQFLLLAGALIVPLGVALGFVHFFQVLRFQRDLRLIDLKSATGTEPKVVDVETPEPFKKKITLASQGIGLDRYLSKKSDLESSFGAIVEEIHVSPKSRKLIEIRLAEKELPKLVSYQDCVSALTEPHSFLIGESLGGVIAQTIRSLPHLLIAGTSGNGKSVFFNQTLISLIRTSPHIQLYLLDLKLGVEVKAYSGLPNVRIAKDADEAVTLLQAVVKEMMARFTYLEKSGRKLIDPVRDGRDLIVVGVDEASVLYKKKNGDREANEATNRARELTDEITKLGRAAGIHLIAATQKVTTKTIETDVQENIGGRICFRVGTLQGSNTVLGNKMAYELPDIKGRAIWNCGNDFIEVQTPFLSESMIEKEISSIQADFSSGARKCLQAMVADKKKESAKADEVQDQVIDSAT
ncbi:MAG: FtsK/SpoIIIE domain-containing protein [Bacteriovoracia bacterium]